MVTQELGGNIQLSSRSDGQAVLLNESSSLIWSFCDGEKTGDQLVQELVAAYPEQPGLDVQVEQALQRFLNQQLIVLDGGLDALEMRGGVVRKLIPDTELQWQLEQIRQFLFGALRLEEAMALDSDLDLLLGEEALRNAMRLDVDSASTINDSSVIPYRGALKSRSFKACLNAIKSELASLLPEVKSEIEISGHAIYPAGAHMGWHSNRSRSDGRIYCSWAQKPDTNFFRFQDPLTGEIVTDWEEPGWNIKSFTIPTSASRFWHCIGAGSLRLSLGFKYPLPD